MTSIKNFNFVIHLKVTISFNLIPLVNQIFQFLALRIAMVLNNSTSTDVLHMSNFTGPNLSGAFEHSLFFASEPNYILINRLNQLAIY